MTGACTDAGDPSVGEATGELTRPGPWAIPASTLATGEMQDVTLTEGGAWTGASGCAGGMTPGAIGLRDFLREHYPQISSIGGYSCREIVGLPGQMSVHGTGRALDVMIPTIGGGADNDAGDVIGNWLIENAEHIGIQRIIWDRWMWSAYPTGYVRSEAYDWPGTSPHADHLHVEISVRASSRSTAFFSGPMAPPTPAGCAVLGSTGGTVDQDGPCFTPYGDARFWRSASGGIAGSYLWTNAWMNATPSNWARWAVRVASGGDYDVEVHVVSDHAVFAQTRYGIDHGGTADTVVIDQGAAGGWRALGRFHFDGTGSEGVSVFDNHDAPVASDQHVCVDAVRVSRVGGPAPTPDAGAGATDAGAAPGTDAGPPGGPMGGDAGETPTPPPSDGGVPSADSGGSAPPVPGGCSVSASAPSGFTLGWWLALVVVVVARRRRA